MNNNYSSEELEKYYPRWITPVLQAAVRNHPVVVLTGARQVGKSTLLRHAEPFCNWRFHSLDDCDVLRQARERPEALWAGTDRVILDEVQKAPELLSAVKLAVDRRPRSCRFVLSGSANLMLMKRVSESLAGRAVYAVLGPLALGEVLESEPSDILVRALRKEWPEERECPAAPLDPAPILLRGLMPSLLRVKEPSAWIQWWEGYVSTYLERDLRQISQIESLVDFRRLMQLAALRSAQLINQSELARDSGLTQPTVHRYLNLLKTSYLFERLPSYASSRTSRLLKSPKAFFLDPGLAVFLSGYFVADELAKAREFGSFFETLIHHHLRVLCGLMTPPARLYFWRKRNGTRVDFVIEHGRRLLAVEVKLTTSPGYRDIQGLRSFLGEHPAASGGLFLHSGREVRWLDENIMAVPWRFVTG